MAVGDWASAANTGVRAGVTLTTVTQATSLPAGVTVSSNGDVTVTKAGVVLSGLDIKGTLYINANNVTVIDSKVTSNDYWVVKIASGVTGTVIQNSTIDGVGSGNDGSHGILGQGTFIANNIYNVENGITLQGSAVIRDNYIHDLKASGAPHYDGIQIDGGISNVTITHNTIIVKHSQTAAVMIDNYFGPISNITVDNNLLVGAGYTIYVDGQFGGGSITGVSITNNHMGPGIWGITNFNGTSPIYTGNVNDGASIAASLPTTGQPPGPSDPTPPSAPAISSFSNDSGTKGDGITNDSTLTLTGTAEANATVKIYDGGNLLGTAVTANGSGAWSYTTVALSNATHSLTATATDTAGNSSAASTALRVTVDTVAPSAPVIASFSTDSGTVGDGITNDNTLTLTGTAAANSTVRVYDGGNLLGIVTANGSGAWIYTTASLPNGGHSFIAQAMDAAGNISTTSAALAVTVDTGGAPIPDSGTNARWVGSVDLGTHPPGYQASLSGDFNGDGTPDVLWHNASNGDVDVWKIANGQWAGSVAVGPHPLGWQPAASGDFNGDDTSDVLWFNPTTGDTDVWKIVDGHWGGSTTIGVHPAGYTPAGIGDFDGDGTSDVFWFNPTTGDTDVWKIVDGHWGGSTTIGVHPAGWTSAGVGDFNQDGTSDVFWFNPTTGDTDVWKIVDGHWGGSTTIGVHPAGWTPAGVGDFNQDGTDDVVWFNAATGNIDIWLVQNGHWMASVDLGNHPLGWSPAGVGDFDHNGTPDVLWREAATNRVETWLLANT